MISLLSFSDVRLHTGGIMMQCRGGNEKVCTHIFFSACFHFSCLQLVHKHRNAEKDLCHSSLCGHTATAGKRDFPCISIWKKLEVVWNRGNDQQDTFKSQCFVFVMTWNGLSGSSKGGGGAVIALRRQYSAVAGAAVSVWVSLVSLSADWWDHRLPTIGRSTFLSAPTTMSSTHTVHELRWLLIWLTRVLTDAPTALEEKYWDWRLEGLIADGHFLSEVTTNQHIDYSRTKIASRCFRPNFKIIWTWPTVWQINPIQKIAVGAPAASMFPSIPLTAQSWPRPHRFGIIRSDYSTYST